MRDITHTIAAAMSLGELSEEEAYFILRFAGRRGYTNAIRRMDPRTTLSRIRRWFVWVGGWEPASLLQWDRDYKAWMFDRDPTPVSVFGHRITFQSKWVEIKIGGGWLVLHHADRNVYWSPNGTPQHPRAIHLCKR